MSQELALSITNLLDCGLVNKGRSLCSTKMTWMLLGMWQKTLVSQEDKIYIGAAFFLEMLRTRGTKL